jgi:hypothetical protein
LKKTPSVEDWLDALDGVAYLVAPSGVILGVGRNGWARFALTVGGDSPSAIDVIGQSLFDMIADDEARSAFRAIHARVASLARSALTYEYRCDAPNLERLMRMSVSALTTCGRLQGVLYQSILVWAKDRVPLEFLSNREALREERRLSAFPFVKICQFCAKVSMKAWGAEWIEPHVYYQRGGDDRVRLSHGVCPECERTRLAPLILEAARSEPVG